jgi:two-component system, NtrC family, sensor kinase
MLQQLQQNSGRTESAIELRRGQRMEAIGLMTSSIVHDLNNLLMIVSGNVDLLRHEMNSEKSDRLLNTIQGMTRRGKALTDQLLSFARSRNVEPGVIDIGSVVEELSESLRHCLRRNIEMKVAVPAAPCLVNVDRGEFELAALNLAVNARDAMPRGGSFTVKVTTVTPDSRGRQPTGWRHGDLIAIEFADTGVGIPGHLIPRVFEPFFTTKRLGEGTGLGLSQVYEFARHSGGHVEISSLQQAGTKVTIYLPRLNRHSRGRSRMLETRSGRGEA